MGVFDKIKNALFEVEYVEVDEKPKKPKKTKHIHKEKEKKKEEKPIVKKIVLPGKKEGKVEHLEEEELKDDNFEVRPKDEVTKENSNNTFKFMDDDDFQVEEPKIISAYDDFNEKNDMPEISHNKFEEQPKKPEVKESSFVEKDPFVDNTHNVIEEPKYKEKQNRLYGVDNSYKLNVHEYGTYEKKEERAYFKPSPIISPIYGVLDKNYKKEDVVSKKEIRITSNYSRSNVNVDDIRNKAFGRRGKKVEEANPEDNTFEVEEEEDNLLVDLSGENDKPEVKKVTVGDAMEYFQDLGLEYNVDYVDVSKDKKETKKPDEKLEDVIEKQITGNLNLDEIKEDKKESDKKEEKKEKREDKKNDSLDDDNLFDLIDSMYKEDN